MLIRSDESERACVVLDLRVENIEVFTTNHDVVWGFYFLFHFVFCRCLEKLEDVPFRFYIFVYFLSWLGLRFASCFSARLRQLCRFCLFQPYGVLGSLGFGCQTSGTIPFGYERLWIWLAGVWLRPFCVYVIDRCSSGDASCTFVSSSFWKRSLFHFFPPKSLNSRWQFCFKCLVNYYSSVTCFRYCVTTSFVLSFYITFGFFTFCTFMVNCDPK